MSDGSTPARRCPVRGDTWVTSYSHDDGAIPQQTVLQAGNAVLIDQVEIIAANSVQASTVLGSYTPNPALAGQPLTHHQRQGFRERRIRAVTDARHALALKRIGERSR